MIRKEIVDYGKDVFKKEEIMKWKNLSVPSETLIRELIKRLEKLETEMRFLSKQFNS